MHALQEKEKMGNLCVWMKNCLIDFCRIFFGHIFLFGGNLLKRPSYQKFSKSGVRGKKTFSVHYSQDGMITRLIHMTSLSQNKNQPHYPFLEIRKGTSCTKFRRIRNALYHPLPDPHPPHWKSTPTCLFLPSIKSHIFWLGPAQVLLSVLLAALEFMVDNPLHSNCQQSAVK